MKERSATRRSEAIENSIRKSLTPKKGEEETMRRLMNNPLR
jgi:metal-responsive CopG/Arc/MetJ family transcriptional regulator